MKSLAKPLPADDAIDRILLTVPEAAQQLAISKRTLERLIVAREFPPPLRIGRAARVPPEDIADYLVKLRKERGDRIGSS